MFKLRASGTKLSAAASGSDDVPLRSPISEFRANQKGATAVEFAIIAAPLFAILLGLLEISLIFIVNVSLGVATSTFATQMRTGQVQAPGSAASSSSGVQMDLADAKTTLCNKMYLIPYTTCMQQLQIDVRPLTSFGNTAAANPISGSTFNSANLCYYSGDAGNIVEMRAYYLFSIVDPLLLPAFSTITSYASSSGSSSGHFFPITNTQVFKAEPFSGETNTGAGC
jgi:Flp pilus assembly protein TadG